MQRTNSHVCTRPVRLPIRRCGQIACLLGIFLTFSGRASQAALTLETVVTGLDDPVGVTHAGDERLFVVLRGGRILILDGDKILPQAFLDIRQLVRDSATEQGLFSVAFHPNYPVTGFFFVNYTDVTGDTVVARYSVSNSDPNLADQGSGVTLLNIAQPFSNHNGGQLQFGPDSFLYIGMGDGGSANDPLCSGQRDDSLLGKMLRIDVNQNVDAPPFYGIPPGNPFVGPGNPADEVWAKGLRNPWRFSFDRLTGDLYIGDVGQSTREEIDFQPAISTGGENYGWKIMEGTICLGSTSGCPVAPPECNAPEFTPPIAQYPTGADCAVVGGYVYRGGRLPGFEGSYFYGDFCSGKLWTATPTGNPFTVQQLGFTAPGLTSFGENVDGELYLVTQSGTLFRFFDPAFSEPGALEFTMASFSAAEGSGSATITARRVGGSGGLVTVDYSTADGTGVAGVDYVATAGTLAWPNGDSTNKSFDVTLLDNNQADVDRVINLLLGSPTGGAQLGQMSAAQLTILDDDVILGPCVPGPTTLCLNNGRFRVEMQWEDFQDLSGLGQAFPLTDDSGYFWFFFPENVEVVVKVLDACADPFNRFWVFAAGLTNVETRLTVVDTETGEQKVYLNPKGMPFDAIQDTQAFATCP